MKYSIIISYRDREEHLSTLLPRLQELFQNKTYEIIIAEQDNKDKFQKNSLYNLAAQKANGELLIFHDVDYYPADDVSYDTEPDVPLYPVRKVIFLDNNNQPRDYYNTPAGYRNFSNDVGDHSGGVFVLHRDLFYKMNGLNPYYIGWGKEDDDTRDRLRLLGYKWKRNEQGTFYGLYHEDNKPDDNDPDFINNHMILANISKTLDSGYKNVYGTVEEFSAGDNVRWLKINDLILF
jgi:hypothetical protein